MGWQLEQAGHLPFPGPANYAACLLMQPSCLPHAHMPPLLKIARQETERKATADGSEFRAQPSVRLKTEAVSSLPKASRETSLKMVSSSPHPSPP